MGAKQSPAGVQPGVIGRRMCAIDKTRVRRVVLEMEIPTLRAPRRPTALPLAKSRHKTSVNRSYTEGRM